jgi:hypothetical protein
MILQLHFHALRGNDRVTPLIHRIHPRSPNIFYFISLAGKASIKHAFLRQLTETTIDVRDPGMDVAGIEAAQGIEDGRPEIANRVEI